MVRSVNITITGKAIRKRISFHGSETQSKNASTSLAYWETVRGTLNMCLIDPATNGGGIVVTPDWEVLLKYALLDKTFGRYPVNRR